MLKKYEKWFEFEDGVIHNEREAFALKPAWAKTLGKWEIILEDPELILKYGNNTTLCGLCNLYFMGDCFNCPIFACTGKMHCNGTPLRMTGITLQEKAKLEYLFLLFVKEATFNNKW